MNDKTNIVSYGILSIFQKIIHKKARHYGRDFNPRLETLAKFVEGNNFIRVQDLQRQGITRP